MLCSHAVFLHPCMKNTASCSQQTWVTQHCNSTGVSHQNLKQASLKHDQDMTTDLGETGAYEHLVATCAHGRLVATMMHHADIGSINPNKDASII